MKIVVFGCTDLTEVVIKFLISQNLKPSLIVSTQESFSISYRNNFKNLRFVSLKSLSIKYNIPYVIFKNNSHLEREIKEQGDFDFAIVAGWYHMISREVRGLFAKGCAGFHASLLPELRGGAPLNWALIQGRSKTGVSMFELGDGIDDGLLYDQEPFDITNEDDITTLVEKSKAATLLMLKRVISSIIEGSVKKYSQIGEISYSLQRSPDNSMIDWTKCSKVINNLVRASTKPYPGAFTYFNNKKIIIWKSFVEENICIYGTPGQIFALKDNLYVCCGQDTVLKIILLEDTTEELSTTDFLKKSHQYFGPLCA